MSGWTIIRRLSRSWRVALLFRHVCRTDMAHVWLAVQRTCVNWITINAAPQRKNSCFVNKDDKKFVWSEQHHVIFLTIVPHFEVNFHNRFLWLLKFSKVDKQSFHFIIHGLVSGLPSNTAKQLGEISFQFFFNFVQLRGNLLHKNG